MGTFMNGLKTYYEVRKQYLSIPVIFVPFFTIIEFIGYIGWIKVAETLLNPWVMMTRTLKSTISLRETFR